MSPASRSVWIEREPRGDLLGSDHSDMFEVSGKFLSSRHLTVEEVMSDHAHICLVLQARVEVSPQGEMARLTMFAVLVGGGSNAAVGKWEGTAGSH